MTRRSPLVMTLRTILLLTAAIGSLCAIVFPNQNAVSRRDSYVVDVSAHLGLSLSLSHPLDYEWGIISPDDCLLTIRNSDNEDTSAIHSIEPRHPVSRALFLGNSRDVIFWGNSADGNAHISLWNPHAGRVFSLVRMTGVVITALSCDPSGQDIVFADSTGRIESVNISNGVRYSLGKIPGTVLALDISKNRDMVCLGVHAWDQFLPNEAVRPMVYLLKEGRPHVIQYGRDSVLDIAFSPQSSRIAYFAYDSGISVINLSGDVLFTDKKGAPSRLSGIPLVTIPEIAWSDDERFLVGAFGDSLRVVSCDSYHETETSSGAISSPRRWCAGWNSSHELVAFSIDIANSARQNTRKLSIAQNGRVHDHYKSPEPTSQKIRKNIVNTRTVASATLIATLFSLILSHRNSGNFWWTFFRKFNKNPSFPESAPPAQHESVE